MRRIEFDGTYWHSLPKTISLDKRKTTYTQKHHPHLRLLRIPEKEWDDAIDKLSYIKGKIS